MARDYYEILQVDRRANYVGIKKSYRKLVMNWHPDKNPKHKEKEGEAKFIEICDAYRVLIDSEKRAVYDRESGENRLDEPPPFGGGFSSQLGGMSFRSTQERPLRCSLEKLYKGAEGKIKYSRTVKDPDTTWYTTVQATLEYTIKAGMKKGTKLTWEGKGNEVGGNKHEDLVYIIEEEPHRVFKRDNDDLIVTKTISHVEARKGFVVHVTTLGDRDLTISFDSIPDPLYVHVVQGEGMPIPEDPSKKGNLRIEFNIKFPSELSSEQKTCF